MENIEQKRELISEAAIGYLGLETTEHGSFLNAAAKLVHYYLPNVDIASDGYVNRFVKADVDEEERRTFIENGEPAEWKLRTGEWDCLADFIGTGQVWRGNDNGKTTALADTTLDALLGSGESYKIDIVAGGKKKTVAGKFIDFKYGLHLFLKKFGYGLDGHDSKTYKVPTEADKLTDVKNAFKAEINASRPVLVHLSNGDTVVGVDYDDEYNTVICDSDVVWEDGFYHHVKWGDIDAISTLKIIQGAGNPPPLPFIDIKTPTNGAVKVGAVFQGEVKEKQYSFDQIEWHTYKGPVSIYKNETVIYFRSLNAYDDESEIAEYEVTNIDRTPPKKPTLTVSRTSLSKDPVTITASFPTGDVEKKQYSFDNKNWKNYTADVTVDFNRTVYFRAVDEAGNAAVTKTTINNILPDLTIKLTGSVKKNQAVWTWNKIKGSGFTVSYIVKLDGKIMAVQQGNSFKVTDPGKHTLSVQAVVNFPGVGTERSKVQAYTLVTKGDTVDPKISKLTAAVKKYDVTFKIKASDNVGITKYIAKLDKQKTQTFDGSVTEIKMSGFAVGKHSVSVTAYDAAGNKSKTKKVTFTVKDVTAPGKVLTLKAPSVTGKYKGTFSWLAAKDNSGKIAKYQIQLDNGKIYTSTKNSISISKLTAGTHTYRVRAIDKAKNVGAWSARKSFTVKDMTAPSKVSVKTRVSGNNVTFTWSTPKDNVGVAKYILKYGNKTVTLNKSAKKYTITGIDSGTCRYSMVAVDAAGNKSKAKSGKFTVKQSLTSINAVEALREVESMFEPCALFAPQEDVLAYSNELKTAANLSDAVSLAADKKEDRGLLAALS